MTEPATYRTNAKAKCGCGAFLSDAPLLSPSRGTPVCNGCHAQEVAKGQPTFGPHDKVVDALRHLAIVASAPRRDPFLDHVSKCRRCGDTTYVRDTHVYDEAFGVARDYTHRCVKCDATFTTETFAASVLASCVATFLLMVGYAFWYASGTRNNLIAAALTLAAVALFAQRVWRLKNRWLAPRWRAPK